MSSRLSNPFRLRASEKIEQDDSFLRLFSPDVFQVIYNLHAADSLWNNLLLIRSSPGAGKTSLLRVFEPSSLLFVYNHREQDHYKELFSWLKKLDVICDSGLRTIGVHVKCTRNYELLEELQIDEWKQQRLFYSLLNSRLVLASLKGLATIGGLKFPDDLSKIDFVHSASENYSKTLQTPCNGADLYRWASKIENDVDDLLDSFLPTTNTVEGHDELFAPLILKAENILIDGIQICERILFTLDDAHKLGLTQRSKLLEDLAESRSNSSIWIAERLEALSEFKSYQGRDYNEINLESYWRDNPGKFKKTLEKIASKRALMSTDNVNSFEEHLVNQLEASEYETNLQGAIQEMSTEITKFATTTTKYDVWIRHISQAQGPIYEKALHHKETQILINRISGKQQMAFEFPLSLAELEDRIDAKLKNAAKLFLSSQAKLPYYFGFSTICTLSSSNIEQFLSFAAPLFEAMLSNEISNRNVSLSCEQQQSIVKKEVYRKWDELKVLVPKAELVMRFLHNIADYCYEVTNSPTASYAPGINGFAINEKNGARLFGEDGWDKNSIYAELQSVILICRAFNLLESKFTKQGKKNQEWEVLYLNKWVCARFDLPLGSGGWNPLSPDQLLKWTRIKV